MEEEPLERDDDLEPPRRQPRGSKRVPWGPIAIVSVVLTILLLAWSWINSQVQESDTDAQARNSAIGALLDQLDQQTSDAIGVDGTIETWVWKSSNGVVTFKLHIGKCHGVDGYAATPARPDNAGQVTIHVLIPGQNSNAAAADLTLKNDADLASLKRTLPKSGLEQCVAGDARLAPTGG